jgi:hypothetical protein
LGFSETEAERIIKEEGLIEVKTTLRQTINRIANRASQRNNDIEEKVLNEWVIYRSDGYLKTLLYAEKASETSLRVFLKYKLGLEKDELGNPKYTGVKLDAKVEEMLQSLLMFVHVHEDIKPNKPDFGGGEAKTIVTKLGERSYLLNDVLSHEQLIEESKKVLAEFLKLKIDRGSMTDEQFNARVNPKLRVCCKS